MSGPIVINGMHGLGDNVHQRAVVRHLLAQGHPLWLKTPWPCVYHDLVGPSLQLVHPQPTLRTQAKNARREHDRYSKTMPYDARVMRVWYDHGSIRTAGSVLGGMLKTTLGHDLPDADFRLPVPPAWRAKAAALVGAHDKPLMILRPLVVRREWGGCNARNPAPAHYAALFQSIRDRFFVVSIADLVPQTEWMVGPKLDADRAFHRGELDIEAVAGLMAQAALVFCSPGFAVPLSQAVGTPVVCVFGGFESSRSFSAGARFAPYLGIDPIKPCECFSHRHACDKRIDLFAARMRLETFIDSHVADRPAIVA